MVESIGPEEGPVGGDTEMAGMEESRMRSLRTTWEGRGQGSARGKCLLTSRLGGRSRREGEAGTDTKAH